MPIQLRSWLTYCVHSLWTFALLSHVDAVLYNLQWKTKKQIPRALPVVLLELSEFIYILFDFLVALSQLQLNRAGTSFLPLHENIKTLKFILISEHSSFHGIYVCPNPAKAPCSSTVRAARAVTEEVPVASMTSIGALARCSLGNAERDVHKLAKDYKLTIPIPLTTVRISKTVEIPVLLLSSWLKYIMSMNLWHTLSGLSEPDDVRCKSQWTLFWNNFEKIMPEHDVFRLQRSGVLSLDRTAAMLLHGDEGRTKKNLPLWFWTLAVS